ncbi:Maf family nucleotide pyrophosphatase [Martelella alba]|uniref:Maf family nucleotide pyrophosphatase n=1 Tax=Martelella alba TaxID=2590451 RepID=UPI0015E85142|nr:Maf family nucleotide pyrophosphatase [Martelella alba]
MRPALILASTSPSRRKLLKNAGLSFSSIRPHVDERAVEAPYRLLGARPEFLAGLLAREKALDVSRRVRDAVVIGGDQVMAFQGKPYSKPESRTQAAEHLRLLSGKSHFLYSALAIARDGEILFETMEPATIRLRNLQENEIEAYLAGLSDEVLFSSGLYQLEGTGVRLFDRVEGDYFTILGLPMLPLLAGLRQLDCIDG